MRSEAPASMDVEVAGVALRVQGRADALKIDGGCVEVCEIKTTRIDPREVCQDDYPAHWAQAEIYAHMFCRETDCGLAEVTLLYVGARGGEQRFRRRFDAAELAERFENYARPYALWARDEARWRESCAFPTPSTATASARWQSASTAPFRRARGR